MEPVNRILRMFVEEIQIHTDEAKNGKRLKHRPSDSPAEPTTEQVFR